MTTIHIDRARLARWAGLLLVAAALPLVAAPAAPVHAEPGCTSEEMPPFSIPPDYGCDDTTDPDTAITAMTPEPNAAGFTNAASASFTFTQVVSDGDTGPWAFQCKLDRPGQAGTWESCTSPKTYDGLTDGEHTFSVYAVDAGDSAIAYVGDPFSSADNEDPTDKDDDGTPATRTWTQDTEAPAVNLFLDGLADDEGNGWPISDSPQVTVLVDASSDVTDFRCQLDGAVTPCAEGDVVLKDLAGGDHIFTATVTDRAGNRSPNLAVRQFTVPHNLTSGRNWKRVDAAGAYKGDVMQTKRAGATITHPAQNVREVRLIAPGGGNLGKIRVRVADGVWHTINLGKGSKTARRTYSVELVGLRSGRVVIESLATRKHPVRVDALVFPHD